MGEDGTSGFPLVTCYLTGKELRAAAEVDASVTPIMPAAQLYMSGMVYTFNPHRMFFNRVTSCWLEEPSFATGLLEREMSRIEDDQLYRVVTCLLYTSGGRGGGPLLPGAGVLCGTKPAAQADPAAL